MLHNETNINLQFSPGTRIVYVGYKHYGSLGRITSHKNGDTFDIELELIQNADHFGHTIAATMKEKYVSSNKVAQSLQISPLTLSRITGVLNFKVVT